MSETLYVFVHHDHNKSSDKFIIITPGLRLRWIAGRRYQVNILRYVFIKQLKQRFHILMHDIGVKQLALFIYYEWYNIMNGIYLQYDITNILFFTNKRIFGIGGFYLKA